LFYLALILVAIVAGTIQTTCGFGAGIILVFVLSQRLGMLSAPALSSATCLGLTTFLAVKYRKYIDLRRCIAPIILYSAFSIAAISLAKRMDLDILSLFFGLFLIFLSVHFLFISKKAALSGSKLSMVLCSAFSGIFSGLFGIGGPLMGLYFLSVSETKESYIANLQTIFTVTSLINLLTRVETGIYTAQLIPWTLVGFCGILTGQFIGSAILKKTDLQSLRKYIYLFIGIAGIFTVVSFFQS